MRQFPFAAIAAVRVISSPSSHLARLFSLPLSLSLSLSLYLYLSLARPLARSFRFPFLPLPAPPIHLRCTAAKRVARAANANPISENNFSRGRILARLFKTSDLTGSRYGTRTPHARLHPPLALYSTPPASRSPPLLFCFCRAGPFSPYHL